jgi:hypothetical protein
VGYLLKDIPPNELASAVRSGAVPSWLTELSRRDLCENRRERQVPRDREDQGVPGERLPAAAARLLTANLMHAGTISGMMKVLTHLGVVIRSRRFFSENRRLLYEHLKRNGFHAVGNWKSLCPRINHRYARQPEICHGNPD